MLRPKLGVLALLLALSAIPAAAAPLQITGRVLHPPKDVQVELRPWAVEHAEALRRLKGEAVPPIASARPRPDGSFAIQVPDSGFYSVVVRAEGTWPWSASSSSWSRRRRSRRSSCRRPRPWRSGRSARTDSPSPESRSRRSP